MYRRSFLRFMSISAAAAICRRGSFASPCCAGGLADKADQPPTKMPRYRIDPRDFEAGEADIRAVCNSAGMQLWRYFPDYELEPLLVRHGGQGPISLFERNGEKEIVIQLDVEGTYWSQFAYQFAHEFCHVLCGFREQGRSNLWFEETLCETASLFALRGMAREWKESPPYPNWAGYRDSLRDYADDIMRGRKHLAAIERHGLAALLNTHAAELRQNPTQRELTGAMAIVLLNLLEREPTHWEAVRWLNATPAPKSEAFPAYLARWQNAVPERRQAFVVEIAKLYGVRFD